nr:hypothetical protein [Tanacetum cinerariifolium]
SYCCSSYTYNDQLKVTAARLKLTTAMVYATEVKYALTASPTIYTSCIKKFWTSAKEVFPKFKAFIKVGQAKSRSTFGSSSVLS